MANSSKASKASEDARGIMSRQRVRIGLGRAGGERAGKGSICATSIAVKRDHAIADSTLYPADHVWTIEEMLHKIGG
jgi:hypothetical protein